VKDRAPIPSPSVVFAFGLTVESIKELEGVSALGFCYWKFFMG